MDLRIVPLLPDHLHPAAALLAARHAAARAREPLLPAGPADLRTAAELLRAATAWPGATARVALHGERLVAFMIAIGARARPGAARAIFVAAAGHAAEPDVAADAYAVLCDAVASADAEVHIETTVADAVVDAVLAGLRFRTWLTLSARALPPAPAATTAAIRQATGDDLDAMIALAAVLRTHHGDPAPAPRAARARQEALLADPRTGVWVALVDGRVVGMLVLVPPGTTVSALHLPEAAIHLPDAIVLPEARGLGIGSALVGEALGWASAIGYRHSTLHVRAGNRDAARFWAARSFRTVARRLVRTVAGSNGPSAS